MYAYREAETPPSGPCARRSPNSMSILSAPAAWRKRVAFVATSDGKLIALSSGVSSSWQTASGPSTRRSGILGKTIVPSRTAVTFTDEQSTERSHGQNAGSACCRCTCVLRNSICSSVKRKACSSLTHSSRPAKTVYSPPNGLRRKKSSYVAVSRWRPFRQCAYAIVMA